MIGCKGWKNVRYSDIFWPQIQCPGQTDEILFVIYLSYKPILWILYVVGKLISVILLVHILLRQQDYYISQLEFHKCCINLLFQPFRSIIITRTRISHNVRHMLESKVISNQLHTKLSNSTHIKLFIVLTQMFRQK